MRNLGTFLLVGLLSACPLLCRAAEEQSPSDRCDAPQAPSRIPHSCPDDGVTCICAGAIQGHEARISGDVPASVPLAFDLLFEGPWELLPLPHNPPLSAGGRPSGNAILPDALKIRAFLQNFRF